MTLRSSSIDRLGRGVHDVLIIGGGINGAVAAAAVAARGAAVALVDRADFASATSQQSSNLVWGGIKYLENYELRLVWKLCRSRNALLAAFPSNIREVRFLVPLEKTAPGLKRTVPALTAGTWLYWLMGRCYTRRPRRLSRAAIGRAEPSVNTAIMKGGVEYSDAYLLDNDARFVFGFVRNALNHGAAAANYVEVNGSTRDDRGVWVTEARDTTTGRAFTIRSRTLVNAAGPWVDPLNRRNGIHTRAHHVFSKGIHLIVDRVAHHDHVVTFFDDTNRMFFVIPMGHRSCIGTTDTRVSSPDTEITDSDREFLFDNVNKRLRLERPLGRRDIIAERCGVRPLVVDGGDEHEFTEWVNLSRKHVVDVDRDSRHVSIFGGKLTDCLNIGEEIASRLGELGVHYKVVAPRWFGEPSRAVHRAFVRDARQLGLGDRAAAAGHESLCDRLWRRYGTKAFGLLEEIGRDPRLAEPVIEGNQYRRCELEFVARSEMVVKLEDFLRRRTKIALLSRHDDLRSAHGLMEACEILFGDSAQQRFDEYFG